VDRGIPERRGVPSLQAIERKSRRANVGGKDTPMQRVHHHEPKRKQELSLDLDEIVRQGARRMFAHALQAEVDAYLMAAKACAMSTSTP